MTITMSVVRRRNSTTGERGWGLFITTDESPEASEPVTFGISWRGDKLAAVLEALNAACPTHAQLYVAEPDELSTRRAEEAGVTMTDTLPEGVTTILALSGTSI